eukprot:188230_1
MESYDQMTQVDAQNDIQDIQMMDHIAMESGAIEDEHLDEKFSNHTGLNLNNYNRRLTLWCIIYMIITIYLIQNGAINYVNFNTFPVSTQFTKQMIRYYSLQISANTVLWSASILLLTCLYCPLCKTNRCFMWCLKICSTFLFVIGGLLQFGFIIGGIDVLCGGADNGYCVVDYIALSIYVTLFSVYMAFDICTSISDQVRVRILVKASIMFIRSFLYFLKWSNLLHDFIKTKPEQNDQENSYIDTITDAMNEYGYLQQTLSYFALFLCCLISIFYIIFIFISKDRISKPSSWATKFIAFALILSVGNTMVSEKFNYSIVAIVTLAFDLQCVE